MTSSDHHSGPAAVQADWMSSDESFRLLVESVRDYAIFMLDPDGYVRSWNLGAERAKGYLAHEIIGKHFSTFYTPEDRAAGLPGRILENARRLGRFEHEGWRVRKDGTLFWADVVITAIHGPAGQVLGFAKVTRDMTEKRLLTTARDEALHASQAKSAFLANMSHELRTPLNAIIGYSEMIAEELRAVGLAQLVADMEKIRYSSHHLLSIISDVLDLSRIEAGRLELRIETVSLEEIARDLAETARPLAARNGNEVVVAIAPEAGAVRADAVRLRQVLYNLFSNACKFTRSGTITIFSGADLSAVSPRVSLAVRDTGPGMTAEQQSRVFDRFYQVEGQSATGGTGLGLAISKLLTEAMGGEIGVSSVPGEGATFRVVLPAPSSGGA